MTFLHHLRRWSAPLLIIIGLLTACGPQLPPVREITGQTMGTSYSIKIISASELDTKALKSDIDYRLDGINRIMSTYDPDSILSRFNSHQGTDWYRVPYSLAYVVNAARQISEATDGAFDITVGPLVNLWGFGPQGPTTSQPPAEALAAARERVGYRKLSVRLDPPALRKSAPELSADLSAIAKGYAVDQIAALLETRDIDRYLVEIGGEVRARGHNAEDKPWQLGIEKPSTNGRSVQQVVPIKRASIATSGDYRNFFEADGQRFSHTIDPASGRPVAHRLASVSVLAPDCMMADGWATALMALGPKRGFELAERLDVAAFFIVRDDRGFTEQASNTFQNRPAER